MAVGAAVPVEIREILEDLGASIEIEDSFAIEPLGTSDEPYAIEGLVDVQVSLTNTGAGFVLAGRAQAVVSAECMRCLIPFELTLDAPVEGFYVFPGREAELPEEQDYEFVVGERVDILPAIRAALTLEIPFAPLHDPDCAGICPSCGADRNVDPCGCAPG